MAAALGLCARHWLSLARRSRVGARSEDAVQRALAPLQAEGWRLRHSLAWQGRGDIDSVAIAPSGIAIAIETKTRTYDGRHLARVREQAGWLREPLGLEDLKPRDLYIRQLWDSKISVDVATMRPSDLGLYSRLCAWTLARAHARSGDAIAIASYLGSSDVFDNAIAAFAEAYADQNERDYAALLKAIRVGRIQAWPPGPTVGAGAAASASGSR